MKRFYVGPKIFYGKDTLKGLWDIEFEKALIVTDKFMVDLKVIDHVTKILKEENITYSIFSQVEPNPSIGTVIKGLIQIMKDKPDTIIALGGGSPIDAAKAMIYFGMKVQESFLSLGKIKKPTFVAIPTKVYPLSRTIKKSLFYAAER